MDIIFFALGVFVGVKFKEQILSVVDFFNKFKK